MPKGPPKAGQFEVLWLPCWVQEARRNRTKTQNSVPDADLKRENGDRDPENEARSEKIDARSHYPVVAWTLSNRPAGTWA